jgi:hypothetical protein
MILDKKNKSSDQEELLKIIEKGGHVQADINNDNNTHKVFNLRMPTKMSISIDEDLNHCVGISKTGWILQAIHEKLMKRKMG